MANCRAKDPTTCRIHGVTGGQGTANSNAAYERLGYPQHHPLTKASYERKREQLRHIDQTDPVAVRRGKRIRADLNRFWVAAAVTHILNQEHGRASLLGVSAIEVDDLRPTGSVRIVGRSSRRNQYMYYIKKSELYAQA